MIELSVDNKSGGYTITKTDREGFHRQLSVSKEELNELKNLINGLEETIQQHSRALQD